MYKLADDENLLLCDTKDLKAILQFASENAAALESEYGRIAKQSVAYIVRAIVALEGEGADQFFGEPAINVADFFTTDPSGKGTINVLDSSSLINQPRRNPSGRTPPSTQWSCSPSWAPRRWPRA